MCELWWEWVQKKRHSDVICYSAVQVYTNAAYTHTHRTYMRSKHHTSLAEFLCSAQMHTQAHTLKVAGERKTKQNEKERASIVMSKNECWKEHKKATLQTVVVCGTLSASSTSTIVFQCTCLGCLTVGWHSTTMRFTCKKQQKLTGTKRCTPNAIKYFFCIHAYYAHVMISSMVIVTWMIVYECEWVRECVSV